MRPVAVLFDVDLTLLDARRSGSKAMAKVARELWGWTGSMDGIPMAGRTDRAILNDLLIAIHGSLPPPEERDRMQARFVHAYGGRLAEQLASTPAIHCPGIPKVLSGVTAAAGMRPGLATGNFRVGAELKLASASIDAGQFVFAGFGDDHEDRAMVVQRAIDGARGLAGCEVTALVVGDTPLDYQAARASGASVALVATGLTPAPRLAALGPDFFAEDLSDPGPLLGWIASLRTARPSPQDSH